MTSKMLSLRLLSATLTSASLILSLILSCLCQQAPAIAASAVVSPRDCFLSFISAVHKAKSLDTVEQYFSQPLRRAYKNYSGAQREAKLKELKEYYIYNYRISDETISGTKEQATANLSAKGRGTARDKRKKKKSFVQTDLMTYVKEGHYWRISAAQFNRSNH